MIKIENVEVNGIKAAIRGMRNPLDSWEKSDSDGWTLGPNDLDLMRKLYKGGTEHRKYMRMVNVSMDITAPLYWWKEFDTYKVGTVANSCSTMHTITKRELTEEDFSWEGLLMLGKDDNDVVTGVSLQINLDSEDEDGEIDDEPLCSYWVDPMAVADLTLQSINSCISAYNNIKKDDIDSALKQDLLKTYWTQIIKLLPTSFNQKRTVQLNYEVASTIIKQRSGHKLDEWRVLVDRLKSLPYITQIMDIY